MDAFEELTKRIIQAQEDVIGPLALEQARKVPGLDIDIASSQVQLSGDKKNIVEQLIEKYQELFGNASVEVCKDATRTLIAQLPKDQIPPILA